MGLQAAMRSADGTCMRTGRLLAAYLIVSFSACAPLVMVVPSEEGPRQAQLAGLQLSALPIPWRGQTQDLSTHFLAVPVQVRNDGMAPVEVATGDFALIDERNRALAPCQLEETPAEDLAATATTPGPVLAHAVPATSADPDREVRFRGPASALMPVTDDRALNLPAGPLLPGRSVNGFLFFRPEEGPRARQRLRLRWQPRSLPQATLEIALRTERQTAP